MHAEIKPKKGSDPFSGSRVMKRVYKFLGIAMILALFWNVHNQGVIAPYFQKRNFQDFIVPYDGTHSSWSDTATIQTEVFATDVYGVAWDGISLGSVFGPIFASLSLTSPPDTVACIVTADSSEPAQCAMRQRAEAMLSHCSQSLNCDWTINVPTDEPYAVVIFDFDDHVSQGAWDLIDAVIISDRADSRVAEVEEIARALISVVSPTTLNLPTWVFGGPRITFNQGESDRRERGLAVLDKARAAEGVTLSQSTLYVFTQQ